MDLTTSENYLEEEHIGKAIMQEFFTKTRLTEKQPGHRLWVNNKETRQTPPDLDNLHPDKIVDLTTKEEITVDIVPVHIPPPPGLEQTIPHPEEMVVDTMPELPVSGGEPIVDIDADKMTEAYKPTHRLTGKQPPPQPVRAIIAQLNNIATTGD
eukprot:6430880-Amphidinium_carterae.2